MAIEIIRLAELTEAERKACTEYGADATLLHACTQGYSNDFDDSPKMQRFIERAAELVRHLDSAIQKFELAKQGTVYSGHGRGFSVAGCLVGEPRQLIGFRYCYPGYISTSFDKGASENFLRTRVGIGLPVLLEFKLAPGLRILPMGAATTHIGEGEYVLGRSIEFDVVDAKFVQIEGVPKNALHLTLECRSA